MAVEPTIHSIGVIGTPGCGKTTFCQQSNMPIIDLADYAKEHDCLGEAGADGAAEMDVEKLSKKWKNPDRLTLVDGHLAHHLPVDAILVIRCNPDELSKRLESFGYWCSNFVSGLADGITGQISFTQQSKEAISDLSAMGQVSDESNEDDDDERLYYELVEHARLSVQIIFSEINTSINEPLS